MRPGLAAASGLALGLAACDAGALKLALQISGGPVQACPSSAVPPAPVCGDVPVACDAVLDVRIARTSAPEEPVVALCAAIPQGGKRDLCSIEHIGLPARQLPEETLEVQVMIWPRAAVKEQPGSGELDCREIYGRPVTIGFGVDGFPEEVSPAPALGGRAYYHPGDELTVVTLGCSDLPSVNRPVCTGRIELAAAVSEFDDWLGAVSPSAPLLVSAGAPRYDTGRGEHEWRELKVLERPAAGAVDPRWTGGVDVLEIEDSLCTLVTASTGGGASALRCGRVADPTARAFDLQGTWLPASRLEVLLAGLGLPAVPPEGLTLGVLLDAAGQPAAGYRIDISPRSDVLYLTADGQEIPGAMTTSSSGLFASRDALYGTDVRAYLPNQPLQARAEGLGGRVTGTVTVVVLRLAG